VVTDSARFRSEVQRTADRLRGLGVARLERADPAGSAATRVRRLIERIVAASSAVTGRDFPLPVLLPHGLADQLSVVGAELADIAEEHQVPDLAQLSQDLLELRRSV